MSVRFDDWPCDGWKLIKFSLTTWGFAWLMVQFWWQGRLTVRFQ